MKAGVLVPQSIRILAEHLTQYVEHIRIVIRTWKRHDTPFHDADLAFDRRSTGLAVALRLVDALSLCRLANLHTVFLDHFVRE